MIRHRKAYCYITHQDRLLVMTHPDHPEAGIQVPGGSIEPGEEPTVGALREACEETGLEATGLEMAGLLGAAEFIHTRINEIHQRYFYHLRCTTAPPATWRHYEFTPSDGSPAPIALDFYWVALDDSMPELIAEMGKMLPVLRENLRHGVDSGD